MATLEALGEPVKIRIIETYLAQLLRAALLQPVLSKV
jgi:hypothetical protein